MPPLKYTDRLSHVDGQGELPLAGHAYEKFGHKKMVLMGRPVMRVAAAPATIDKSFARGGR